MTASLVLDEGPELVDRLASGGCGEDAHRGRLDHAAGLVHVAEGDVARLEQQRGGAGGHGLVGLVDDHTTEHAAHDGDQSFRLEDAQRFPQRRARDAEALDEVGLTPERVALRQLAAHDQRTQLVGDLFRFLA